MKAVLFALRLNELLGAGVILNHIASNLLSLTIYEFSLYSIFNQLHC